MFVKPPTSFGGMIDHTPRRRMREKHASQLLEEWSSGLTDVQLQRFWTLRLGKRLCQGNGGATTVGLHQ